MELSERLNQIKNTVPGIRLTRIIPYPCCDHCFYLGWETGDAKEGDDYHGIYICSLHHEISFSDYNPKRLSCPHLVVCHDYLQQKEK